MSDLPLPSFPADAADRSFYLGHIWKRVEKTEVWNLLAAEGINLWSVRLYWDTRLPRRGYHRGYCLVKFQTRELAVLAWARLDGLLRWNRKLVVGPVNKPGALLPSQEELDAARRPQSSHGRIVYVNVVKGDGVNTPWRSKLVDREMLDSAVKEGWRHVVPPQRRTDADTDNDERKCPTNEDFSEYDAEELYPDVFRMLRARGIDPKAGDATGDAPPPDSERSSQAAKKDIWSDPSLLETIRRNAEKVGPGWGGYAPFQANPGLRAIDPSEVPALNWHPFSTSPYRLRDHRGEVMLDLNPSTPEWEEGEERIESLWFLLAQASGEWTELELRDKENTLPLAEDVSARVGDVQVSDSWPHMVSMRL